MLFKNTASFLKTYVNNVFGFPQLSDCVKSILEGWETARKKAGQEKYMHKTDRGVLSIRRMFINIGAIAGAIIGQLFSLIFFCFIFVVLLWLITVPIQSFFCFFLTSGRLRCKSQLLLFWPWLQCWPPAARGPARAPKGDHARRRRRRPRNASACQVAASRSKYQRQYQLPGARRFNRRNKR